MAWILVDQYTRNQIRSDSTRIYIFGDNESRYGLGGQAKEARGEPNTIGIATKANPSHSPQAFWDDQHFDYQVKVLERDLAKIEAAIRQGRDIVFPKSGISTGLAALPKRAPRTFAYLQQRLTQLTELANTLGPAHPSDLELVAPGIS